VEGLEQLGQHVGGQYEPRPLPEGISRTKIDGQERNSAPYDTGRTAFRQGLASLSG
jgi:hypothetical protein